MIVSREGNPDVGMGTFPGTQWCECMDPILKHANPSCIACGGKGIIQYPEDMTSVHIEEFRRLAAARICFENALTIWNDEDMSEVPISDILAYFDKDEDVKVKDIVIHRGKEYMVISADIVSGIQNDLYMLCSLERV